MYHLTLANLTADARHIDILAEIEKRDVPEEELRALLVNFTGLDPIANADVGAEIRIRVRRESYRLRMEQGMLLFSDALELDATGQSMSVDEVLDEIRGSAGEPEPEISIPTRAAPAATPAPESEETYVSPLQPFDYGNRREAIPVAAPAPVPRNLRLTVSLAVAAALLLGAEVFMAWPVNDDFAPTGFAALASAEADRAQEPLTGVYLTGSEPGQHGIVVGGPGELKIFELTAVEAPRVVNAAYRLGRADSKLWFATDQPGGAIEAAADGSLRYGGETYRKIP